jgi:hypothetical protein
MTIAAEPLESAFGMTSSFPSYFPTTLGSKKPDHISPTCLRVIVIGLDFGN